MEENEVVSCELKFSGVHDVLVIHQKGEGSSSTRFIDLHQNPFVIGYGKFLESENLFHFLVSRYDPNAIIVHVKRNDFGFLERRSFRDGLVYDKKAHVVNIVIDV